MGSWCTELYRKLEDSIDIIDSLVKEYSSISSSSEIPPGKKFQIYKLIMDLREKIVQARMIVREYCSET